MHMGTVAPAMRRHPEPSTRERKREGGVKEKEVEREKEKESDRWEEKYAHGDGGSIDRPLLMVV